jgi:hypothetical protein
VRVRLLLAWSLVFIVLGSWSCAALPRNNVSNFDDKLNTITQPYSFNFAAWEFNTLFSDISQRIADPQPEAALNSQSVLNYFSDIGQLNSLMSDSRLAQIGRAHV